MGILDYVSAARVETYNVFALCQLCQNEIPPIEYSSPAVNY